ncbi:MAG: cyclase family protein [Candidatus Helarchaeota archaeon]
MEFRYTELYDISIPISSNTPIYPGDTKIEVKPLYSIQKGDSANISELKLGTHSGTHVDVPYHFLQEGEKLNTISLDKFCGNAKVVELDVAEKITPKDLTAFLIQKDEIILFKTKNSKLWNLNEFQKDFIYLSPEAAEYLVRQGVKLVGIDYLSIEKYKSENHLTHTTLLQNGILILEGINLREVPSGEYFLICFPLKLIGVDGSPVRAVLFEK